MESVSLVHMKDVITTRLQVHFELLSKRTKGDFRSLLVDTVLEELFGRERCAEERQTLLLFTAPLMRALLLEHRRSGGALAGKRPRALHRALRRLDSVAPQHVQMVDLYHFCGLSVTETAAVLGRAEHEIARDLRFVKAWIANEMRGGRRARTD